MKFKHILMTSFFWLMSLAANAETVTYFVNDLLGSPVAAMDQSGSLLWRESYNPYGEKRIKPSQNSNDVGYTGHQSDDFTGLTYMQARYYDPIIGRFYSTDPAEYLDANPVMSFNRYLYVNNNPYTYNDPEGEVLNFVAKIGFDATITVLINAATGQPLNITGALGDAVKNAWNPAKSAKNVQKLYKVLNPGDKPVKRTGPKGVDPKHHNANMMVRDADGKVKSHERFVSGDMTPEQKAMGWPKGSLQSHTEIKGLKKAELKPGYSVTFAGQKQPCNSCKNAMNNAAAKHNVKIVYKWRRSGKTYKWTAGRNRKKN